MARQDIPRAVCTVVGEVLGSHYYSHARLESLFAEAGAPGDVPEGSCVNKSVAWLKRASDDPACDGLRVLGRFIEEFMEVEPAAQSDLWRERRARVERILAQNNLSYLPGGHVVTVGASPQARTLERLFQERDLGALEIEFRRALDGVADPPAAVTASCAMLEALFKVYIEDERLELPTSPTIKPLWGVVQRHLLLDPGRFEDDDIKKILSGLSSIVDGIGALRTHAGSAHGRGRRPYALHERHAVLALNGAATLATFVIQTWTARRNASAP